MMRTSYDPKADAMFVWLTPEGTKSSRTKEVASGVLLDFDASGAVIGIEVLGVNHRVAHRPGKAA